MTAVPTYSTFELALVAFGGLSLVALLVVLIAAAWLRWHGETLGGEPTRSRDEVRAIQARERLVDAAHAWAPEPGEPVTRRKGAA